VPRTSRVEKRPPLIGRRLSQGLDKNPLNGLRIDIHRIGGRTLNGRNLFRIGHGILVFISALEEFCTGTPSRPRLCVKSGSLSLYATSDRRALHRKVAELVRVPPGYGKSTGILTNSATPGDQRNCG